MCAPAAVAIAGLGVGMLQAGASSAASNADYAAKSAAWSQNVVNSEAAARDEEKQIIGNQLAEQAKTNQQLQISELTQAEKQGQEGARAAGGNVSGVSVDNILQDIAGKSEVNRTYADMNYKFIVAGTQQQLTASDDQEQSRINSMPLPQSPSPLAPLIGIAGAGVKAFGALNTGGGSLGD